MTRRRLGLLVLVVVALLAVVALAAGGRPLGSSGGKGGGLPRTFWDYLFTTVLIIGAVWSLGVCWTLIFYRRARQELEPFRSRTGRALAILFIVCAIVVFVGRHINLNHLLHPHAATTTTPTAIIPGGPRNSPGNPGSHPIQFRLSELLVVLVMVAALGAIYAATRSRKGVRTRGSRTAPEAIAAALDESLDDLRLDPDLRRAIVAAYARMEKALAAAGVPRHPAEAPLEYLERALLALDTSAHAVRRLTDLFEWAKFSHHAPEPGMRDEAIDALAAVRDEIRTSGQVTA